MLKRYKKYSFLFQELVHRDFTKKYKRTALGIGWSVLSPLLQLLVMKIMLTKFFATGIEHYTTFLFAGNIVFNYYNESTSSGMTVLAENSAIISKVNVPKYMFVFSKNISSLISFLLTVVVFFVLAALDGIEFTWKITMLIFPIVCLVLFNIGLGLVLSACYTFFRDLQYLYSIFTFLLMYMSAVFYDISAYSDFAQKLFLLNPIYLFIRYFRKIVMEQTIPTIWFHLLMILDVCIVMIGGFYMYKKYNHDFLYYF